MAITFVALENQQLVDRIAGDYVVWMVALIAQRVIRHNGVGHRRENRAKTVFSVQPRADEVERTLDRPLFNTARKQRFNELGDAIDAETQRADPMTGRVDRILVFVVGRTDEKFLDIDVARIFRFRFQYGQNQQRHHHSARPIGNLVDVKRRPLRHEHGFDTHHRHSAPRHLFEQCQSNARKYVCPGGAAVGKNRIARTAHMRRVRIITDQLQRVVSLDRCTDIEITVMVKRPATVLGFLNSPQIDGKLALNLVVRLAKVVIEHNIFGGDRRICLKFERPMAVTLLLIEQPVPGRAHDRFGTI